MEPNVKYIQNILGYRNFTKYVIVDSFVIENWPISRFELCFKSLETLFRWKIKFQFHFEEKILDLHRVLDPKETTEADLQDMNGGFAFSS